ncbi:helix-turn-helix domain-containing protein [Pedobacter glucosidilyticus]|uniref:helix-turn-helix domain-containing protein n=1 Tax=Pedobacter glucosidilyticus TaxID=1122941 RepID=UPI0026F2EA96|nr:helix-turn-helix transcriptional regulator [Pedobacter glucosidilyticus]
MASANLNSEIEEYVIKKVKEMRISANMSQAELAFKLGTAYGFIGNVESPKYRAKYNLNHLNKLAKIFNCSVKDFLPEKPL